ncbi:MAG: type IV pilin protein, partial [bacterium]
IRTFAVPRPRAPGGRDAATRWKDDRCSIGRPEGALARRLLAAAVTQSIHPDGGVGVLRNERGLTLIELMIVVIIIGLLAAIGYPLFENFTNRARVASVKNNMHAVQVAVEEFSTRNDGTYPANAAATTIDGGLTLGNLMAGATMPTNPFTAAPTSLDWSNAAGTAPSTDAAGGIALNTTQSVPGGAYDQYEVIGADQDNVPLSLVLTNH